MSQRSTYGFGRRSANAAPPPSPDDRGAAREMALNILNGAAQSADRLQRRLERRGFDTETASATVEYMRELGYVDDAALAQSVSNRRCHDGYGKARVAADLRGRGIETTVVDTVMREWNPDDDVDRALAVARKHTTTLHSTDPALRDRARRRLAGMLQRRGFAGDTVRTVLVRLATDLDRED